MAKEKDRITGNELVPLFIPKTGPGDDERFLAVNGRRILVQTNKTVYVDPMFAEVYANSIASDEAAAKFIEENAK